MAKPLSYKAWTTHEEKVLLTYWPSALPIKHWIPLLNGRSFQSIFDHARDMNLGPRPIKCRSTYSVVWEQVISILTEGDQLTSRALAERIGCTMRQVTNLFAKRNQEDRIAHVTKWRRAPNGKIWVEVWAIGDGDDAPKPKSKSNAVLHREKRARVARRAKVQSCGSFGAAMAQLAQVSL